MNPHDVAEIRELDRLWSVRCNCGSAWVRERRQDAIDAHAGHFGVMQARAALRKEGDGS